MADLDHCIFCNASLRGVRSRSRAGWRFCSDHRAGFQPVKYSTYCAVCDSSIEAGEDALMYKLDGVWIFVHTYAVCQQNLSRKGRTPPFTNTSAADQNPHRKILYVTDSAPPEVVKAAYRALSTLHHPDHGGSTEMMQKINAAYSALLGQTK